MSAPEVAIGRLATRVRAPEPEAAFATGQLVRAAAGGLGPRLDTALSRAGLTDEAVVVLPRVEVRLCLRGDVGETELAEAWATAIARAVVAVPAADALDGEAVAFRDAWAAEAVVLRAAAAGEPLPWWAEELGLRPHAGVIAEILGRWIARDPVRASWRMVDLLRTAAPAALPDAAAAQRLARHLMQAVQRAIAMDPVPVMQHGSALAAMLARLPASLRAALAAVPAERRAPWLAAAVIAKAPAHVAALPAALARVPVLATEMPDATKVEPMDTAIAPEPVEVWCGGLLLLIRPIGHLLPEWLALGEGLSARLMVLGLTALRRTAEPLAPAARRAALERDRPLLALFAGTPPPDAPLDEVPLDLALAAEADVALARLTTLIPEGIAHAPGALQRAYGRDPFAADRANDALCRLVLRPGRLTFGDGSATLAWPLDHADIALRRAGWDLDPGWVPWLGRRIAFRYGGP